MEPVQFVCVWKDLSAPEVEEVKALWRRYRALGDESAINTRAYELVYVLKNSKGEVGGVSTAKRVRAPLLNNHLFFEFRCFIAPSHRAPGLDTVIAKKTKDFLEQLGEPDVKGLLMVVENPGLKRQRTKAVWPGTGMVFAGYTQQGHHIRVGYFKNARI